MKIQHSNSFRRLRCYNEAVDRALSRHGTSLRRIFELYAYTNRDEDDELVEDMGLGLFEEEEEESRGGRGRGGGRGGRGGRGKGRGKKK